MKVLNTDDGGRARPPSIEERLDALNAHQIGPNVDYLVQTGRIRESDRAAWRLMFERDYEAAIEAAQRLPAASVRGPVDDATYLAYAAATKVGVVTLGQGARNLLGG